MKEKEFRIDGIPTERITEIASLTVAATTKIPGNETPERQGGYLVIRNKKNGTPLLIERIGICLPVDVKKTHYLGLEKGRRLIRSMKSFGHISSHQSRDPKFKKWGKWGGAIIAGDYIISFSGLKELFDEAAVVVLALKIGWLNMSEVHEIIEISGNTFVKPLYNMVAIMESNEA
ncbi:MAG: hypothetical protein Q8M92_09335 [Candidatus Subteraquimicrobiales bacterium]|nr:hypothetical protein [Candidatus Subteraquimicrobiales bacterium]